jgi:hypothetical protein
MRKGEAEPVNSRSPLRSGSLREPPGVVWLRDGREFTSPGNSRILLDYGGTLWYHRDTLETLRGEVLCISNV